MKQRLLKHKICIIGIIIVLLLASVVIGLNLWDKWHTSKETNTDTGYGFFKISNKDLGDYDDVGVMIMECDDTEEFRVLSGATVTHQENKYVQGVGALEIDNLNGNYRDYASIRGVDISDYKTGSIHMSVYIKSPERQPNSVISVEVSSSGSCDNNEIAWEIPVYILESGWNELYLGIEDAVVTEGEPDYTNINYLAMMAMYEEPALDIIVDNIYATSTPGMDLSGGDNVITATTKSGLLMDFDTLDGITSQGSLSLTSVAGEYKEGKGALVVSNPNEVWVMANLKKADLSVYKHGRISFWVYINDASYVRDGLIALELSSSGTFDKNEMCWFYEGSNLKTGWNQVEFIFPSSMQTEEPMDLKNVNYLRMYGLDCSKSLQLILDELAIGEATSQIPENGVILNCETVEGYTVHSDNDFTLADGKAEHKEGNRAFKSVGDKTVWWQVQMTQLLDVSAYAEGGISLWLYVDEPGKLQDTVNIELGSGGTYDVNEYEWRVSGLQAGWNQLKLEFSNAQVTGSPDLKKIDFFRTYAFTNGNVVAILDDVRAILFDKKAAAEGMLLDCDSLKNIIIPSTATVVLSKGEYREGTAAIMVKNPNDVWFEANLETKDLSDYQKATLSFWLYVNDASYVKNGSIWLELSSSGTYDKQEMSWAVSGLELKDGWNHVDLDFPSDMTTQPPIDLAKVNYLRMYGIDCDKALQVIVDEIFIEKREGAVNEPDNSEDDEASVADNILFNCDSTEGYTAHSDSAFSVTTKEGEFKEGTGAYKAEGSGVVWWQVQMPKKDVSAYVDGGIEMWLYIDEPTKLADKICVELGSGGTCDVNEYEWKISDLQKGWNQVTLKFADVQIVNGSLDLSAVNYFRVYAYTTSDITVILDDVHMIAAETEEPEAPKEGLILSCDNTTGCVLDSPNVFSVATKKGEYKEGAGAFKSIGQGMVWWWMRLDTPVDISPYKAGALRMWLHVSDVSKLGSTVTVELGSAGEPDKYEYSWEVAGLQVGWNQLELPFKDAKTAEDGNKPNMSSINWIRIYAVTTGEITTMVDDIHAVNTKEIKPDVVILNADATEGYGIHSDNNFSVTTTEGEYKEGSGAFKSQGSNVVWWQVQMYNTVDLSAYADDGLVLWLYVSDVSKLTGPVTIELGSANTADQNEYSWDVSGLQSGWNKLQLRFDEARETGGKPDMSSINWFRLYAYTSGSVTAILDDVRAIEMAEFTEEKDGITLINADSTEGYGIHSDNTFSVTTDEGECKEGIGAFKSQGANVVWWQVQMYQTVDVSAYADDALTLWLYVSDVSKLTGPVTIELGSANSADQNEYSWEIGGLQSGWNKLQLRFDEARVTGGKPNMSGVNWFRLYAYTSGEVTAILDDVRTVSCSN